MKQILTYNFYSFCYFPGALGVMYEYGIGARRNTDSAYICLKGASDRGNVYAMGNLVAHYYHRKLYTKSADLASRFGFMAVAKYLFRSHDFLEHFYLFLWDLGYSGFNLSV